MENKNSFQKGWYKLPQEKVAEARGKIMAATDVTTRQAFRDRLNGKVSHTHEEWEAINKIFAEYGIGIRKIWGKVYETE
jgi:uncharacterized protein (DUF111 family)